MMNSNMTHVKISSVPEELRVASSQCLKILQKALEEMERLNLGEEFIPTSFTTMVQAKSIVAEGKRRAESLAKLLEMTLRITRG